MHGDFTRVTFRPERHYLGVLEQQGRAQLDAEWNEQVAIQAHLGHTANRDIIGPSGAPLDEAGFAVQVQAGDLLIGAGRYYVEGIVCENEQDVLITDQPDLPTFTLPASAGLYLAYLDVWFRHITALEVPAIREVALGGPDTTTRLKTVWQVKLLRVGDAGMDANCLTTFAAYDALVAPPTGRLAARAQPEAATDDLCVIAPGAGFRRLENQLYRVEIHGAGGLNTATFKWSRDNGSVVARLAAIVGDEVTVTAEGRDSYLAFAPGQWIEVTDERRELEGVPGTLVQITAVDGVLLTVDLATATGPLTAAAFPLDRLPKVRRWDSAGLATVAVPVDNDGFLPLEDGVEVRFTPGTYRTGDYWLIPARTNTAAIEWPVDAVTGVPLPQPRQGVQHSYARLSLIEATAGGGGGGLQFTVRSDCRNLFPPLTQLVSLYYVSGDGQDAIPDPTQPQTFLPLEQPLEVGVARGQWPVEGARVRFTVIEGNGRLQGAGATAEVATGPTGVAPCVWELDPATPSQQVEAVLLDAAGNPLHLPVRFTAQLLLVTGLYYIGGDGQEAVLDPANPAQFLPLAPLQVGVARGQTPVPNARVRFIVTQGNGQLQGAGAAAELLTGADGTAACTWQLDTVTPNQRVEAVLLDAGGNPLHLPVRFTATLPRTAAQVSYDPANSPPLANARTVQEAIDILAGLGGREPGIVIRQLLLTNAAGQNVPFRNDADMPVDQLVRGLRVVCDRPLNPAMLTRPTCFVTLDLPYPMNSADIELWSNAMIGFQPIILDGEITVERESVLWQPAEATRVWLLQMLFVTLARRNRGDRVLCHLTLKGNFISGADAPNLWLDGDAFGVPRRRGNVNATELALPSGDGVRGGDFECWFWLRPAGQQEPADPTRPTGEVVLVDPTPIPVNPTRRGTTRPRG